MTMTAVTTGALKRIFKGEKVYHPIFKILGHKIEVEPKSNKQRVKLTLSDGNDCLEGASLAFYLSDLKLVGFIELLDYTVISNRCDEKKNIFILEARVIETDETRGVKRQTESQNCPVKRRKSDCLQDKVNVPEFCSTFVKVEPEEENLEKTLANLDLTQYNGQEEIETTRVRNGVKYSFKSISQVKRLTLGTIVDVVGVIAKVYNCQNSERTIELVQDNSYLKVVLVGKKAIDFPNKPRSPVVAIKKGQVDASAQQPFLKFASFTTFEFFPSMREAKKCHDPLAPKMVQRPPEYNFTRLSEVKDLPIYTIIDVIAIIKTVNNFKIIKSRRGTFSVRTIVIVDNENNEETVKFWWREAAIFPKVKENTVIAFKHLKIQGYKGKRELEFISSSSYSFKVGHLPECRRLRFWLENQKNEKQSFMAMKKMPQDHLSLLQLSVAETIGQKEGLYNVKAWVWGCKAEESIYKGCPNDTCKAKLIQTSDGTYTCDSCETETSSSKDYYSIDFCLKDHSGYTWVTAFNDEAQRIIGSKAETWSSIYHSRFNEYKCRIRRGIVKPYLFTIQTKLVNDNGEMVLTKIMKGVYSCDYVNHSNNLLARLKQLQL